eukprot:TCONS_00050521-protein
MSFIVNLNALKMQSDISADDNGSYMNGYSRPTSVTFNGDSYIISKYNGTSNSCKTFHRKIIRLRKDGGENYFQYCLLQYNFDGEERSFTVASHGNAKKAGSYKQTQSSVRNMVKTTGKSNKPSETTRKVNKELGGTLKATSSGSLPRNNCQVRNLNRANKGETSKKDTLAMMMEECKKTMKSSRYFIRRVEGAPEPMCIIGSEAAFQDLDRYCCKMPQGLNLVLIVDPTFNFGDFFFTPITYQNLAVLRKSTNKPKIDMGPALIHYRKMFSSYHYFSSSLVGIHPELSELKCFGTDGEATLQSAFSKTFPFSDQLRCFIHSKRNVEEKLKELALPMTSKQTIIHDIFGKVEGTHKIEGLADAPDANMFDIYVESIKNKWDDIELPHVPKNLSPKFHEWFTKNVVPYMRSHMLTNIRQRNGISEDFSTNQSESLNAKIR